LQLYYNPNHTLTPKLYSKNFVSLYFEYFKEQDSGQAFIKPGSFLLKMQADFLGAQENMGKFFMQLSQTFRFWKPKIFINLQYGGGLGITEPKQYSYYIINAFSLGLAYPFRLGNAYLSSVLNCRYITYDHPSTDPLYTLYWWAPGLHYKLEFPGDFSIWTENKNHGDDLTRGLSGKRFYFFAEPQCWYKLTKTLSIGTKINIYYHVLSPENTLQVYPTLGLKCRI
jgi:hypothetical protein